MKLLKIRSRYWQIFLIVLFFILLFFNPDVILSKGYVGGLEINYLDLRFRIEGILILLILLGNVYQRLDIPLGVYLTLLVVGIFRSTLPFVWGIYKFLNLVLLFLAPLILIQKIVKLGKADKRSVAKALTLLGFLVSLVALLQILGGQTYINSWLHAFFIKLGEPPLFSSKVVCCAKFFPRAYGFLPHPNILAFVSLVFMSFLIYLERGFTLKVVPFILLVILSMSKVGGVVLVLIWLIYLIKPRFTLRKFKLLLFLFLILVLLAPFLIWYAGVLGLNKYYFFKTRNIAFDYFLEIANLKRLLVGIGFLNYFNVLIKHVKLVVYNGTLFIEPIHNSLWLYTMEFGIVGLLFFIYFYFNFFCNKYKKMKDSYARNLVLTILLVYTMFMAFDHFLYY